MGILRERSQINFNGNWISNEEQRYLWEEENDVVREDDHSQDNQNNTPTVNVSAEWNEDEWDDGWTGHPLEMRQSSDIIMCMRICRIKKEQVV